MAYSSQRPPSPLVDKPAFNHRKRSPSPKSMSSGRNQSLTDAQIDSDLSNKLRKIVQKAMRARLYLLHQVGPLTFLIGGDSPEHKYKVTIGKQTCSCGKGPHCIHLLFVMLRVFQVKETDPLLWAKELKNFEVETLFRGYHRRIAKLTKGKKQPVTDGRLKANQLSERTLQNGGGNQKDKDDDETCPICLLEMVEGESMTICTEGCLNKLHHHCMSIWAEECKRRKEPLLCPLCRSQWKSKKSVIKSSNNSLTSNQSGRSDAVRESVSPTLNLVQEDVGLPQGEIIPDEFKELTQPWVQIFGRDMVACLLSRDWKNRETGLKYMSRKVTKVLNEKRTTTSYQQTRWSVLEVCCSVLKTMSSDPVYNVYVGALRTFRAILSCVNYRHRDDLKTFHEMVFPVVENIVLKCADSNRRVTVVSLKVLQEFIKWDSHPLGASISTAAVRSSGMDFIINSLARYDTVDELSWQLRLGYLVFLRRIYDENLEFVIGIPEEDLDELSIQPVSLDPDFDMSDFLDSLEQKIEPVPSERLFSSDTLEKLRKLLRFCATSTNCKHKNVRQMALGLLVRTTQIVAKDRETFNSLKVLLKSLKPNIQHILQRQLSSDRLIDKTPTSLSPPPEDYSAEDIVVNETGDVTRSGKEVGNGGAKTNRRSGAGILTPPSTPPRCDSASASPPSTTSTPRNRLSQLKQMYVPNCEEMVAEEEAEALAKAINLSLTRMQSTVPAELSQETKDEIVIHVQPEGNKSDDDNKHVYLESVHWRKGGLLGTGAYSSCFEVIDIKTGRLMAVKQVSFCRNSISEQEKVKKAVLDEINLLYKLRHPHTVQCLGATQHLNHFNIFMEIMPGGSLSRLLSRFGPFQNSVILKYTRQILMALAYLHDNGCLHRDIKGANILVDSTGQVVKLSDFGTAAKLLSQGTGTHEFCGQLLGTIAFMAPEVIRGEHYGRKCDIWSVGCVLIEMCTCEPPWSAEAVSNHLALMYKIASTTSPPPIPDNLDPGLRDVALRCLEPNDSERPTALDLLKHPVFRM